MLRQAGFNLIELMMGMTIGLLLIAGALRLYQTNLIATAATLKTGHLAHELQQLLDLMAAETRRSGYWGGEPPGDDSHDNPFMRPDYRLRTGRGRGEAADTCILYSYDLNHDKAIGVGSQHLSLPFVNRANLEVFGFRLNGGRLQMRNGGRGHDCRSGSWQTLTTADTAITTLVFTLSRHCLNAARPGQPCRRGAPAQLIRYLHIRLAGRSRSDPAVRTEVDTRVAIRNHRQVRQW